MFDLDREIDSWCRDVLGARCVNTAGMDELVDHVHCEVEKLRGQGMNAEEAFNAATERMGDTRELAREYTKNYGPVARLVQKLMRLENCAAHRVHYKLFIGHALAWATAMIVTALVANAFDAPKSIAGAITLALILGYVGSEHLLRKALKKHY